MPRPFAVHERRPLIDPIQVCELRGTERRAGTARRGFVTIMIGVPDTEELGQGVKLAATARKRRVRPPRCSASAFPPSSCPASACPASTAVPVVVAVDRRAEGVKMLSRVPRQTRASFACTA